MCTLSYVPINKNDFIFTTNRDEAPNRGALSPCHYEMGGAVFLYPKDKEANGTWMLCSDKNISLCLLNGAFQKHQHKPPYRKSRGLVVLECASYQSSIDFVVNYNFSKIEPFTLIVLRYEDDLILEEIRWNGESIHLRVLDSTIPQIWSSATLYNEDARKQREKWFSDWVSNSEMSAEDVLHFHKNAGSGDPTNDLLMNRKNKVRTTSITQIFRNNKEVTMYYENILNHESTKISLTKKEPC